jgi:integrase
MPKLTLTDRYIKSAKPAPVGGRIIHWDAAQPALGVRVTDKGKKSFVVVRRLADSDKLHYSTLGAYPELSLADARRRAPEVLRTLAQGQTPKQLEEERKRVEEERKRAEAARFRNTFRSVAEFFITEHLPRLRGKRPAEALVRDTLIVAWGDRPVTDIGRRDVIELVKRVAHDRGRYAAHHTYAQASKLFNWALANDKGGLEFNPCSRLKIVDLIGPAVARDRVLSDRELALVWRAACTLGYPFGDLYRALMLTGQRLAEIAEARWSEMDIGKAVLVIPAERMKSKITHAVPLAPAMLALLDGLPRFAGGDFVFSTAGGRRPVSGFSKAKARLDREVAKIGEVADFDIHDIRRSVRTNLSSLGVAPLIAELTIGHKQQGVQAVYDLHRYDAEKRAALEAWEAKLLGIVKAKA